MKLLTPEEEAGHDWANKWGAIKGGSIASALSLPAAYVANQRYPYYRSLTPALKGFSVVMVVVPAIIIGAENEGARYEKSLWTGAGKRVMDEQEVAKRAEEAKMDSIQKWKAWGKKNQYSIVSGAWLATMIGSWTYVAQNKTQTTTQKIIQARMIAQAATLVLLGTAAFLTYQTPEEAAKVDHVDHSWKQTLKALDEEEAEADAVVKHMKQSPSLPKKASTAA